MKDNFRIKFLKFLYQKKRSILYPGYFSHFNSFLIDSIGTEEFRAYRLELNICAKRFAKLEKIEKLDPEVEILNNLYPEFQIENTSAYLIFLIETEFKLYICLLTDSNYQRLIELKNNPFVHRVKIPIIIDQYFITPPHI